MVTQQVVALSSRLNTTGRAVDQLKVQTSGELHHTLMRSPISRNLQVCVLVSTVVVSELPFLQTRLRAAESTLEQLRRKSSGLHLQHHSPQMLALDSSSSSVAPPI